METVCGIHAVREALVGDMQSVEHVHFQQGMKNPRVQELIDLCHKRAVAVRFERIEVLDRLAQGANHQGVVAVQGGHGYAELEDVLAGLGKHALVLVLDGVEDPRNLGASIRTACVAGADAVVIPERRAVGLTPSAVQAASGAVAHLPVVRVANLARTLERLKEEKFWTVALDEHAQMAYHQADYRGRCAVVAGGEQKGLHQLLKKKCDFLVRIPAPGKISTLNVSVATGIVLFEATRQRTGKAG
jgi:23S rRNA (guanosine2251-2'-O)-methyltransferase